MGELPYKPLVEYGSIWSSPIGVGGLAGETPPTNNFEQLIGSYSLRERYESVMCALILTRRDIETLTPVAPLGDLGRLLAHIKYGVGTATDDIYCDWNYGTSISIPAGAGKVEVNAVQTGIDLGGANAGMFTRVLLTAMLAEGARSSLGAPTLTYAVNVPAGGLIPAIVPIPNRAKRVVVGSSAGIASDVTVLIGLFGGGGNFFTLSQPADAEIRTRGVEIPGPAVIVQLNSAGGENKVQVSFILDG